MKAGEFLLRGSAYAAPREVAAKAASALTSVGAVRDTTFNANHSVAFRFVVPASRLRELRERLVETGMHFDPSSEASLEAKADMDSTDSIGATLEIRFVRR